MARTSLACLSLNVSMRCACCALLHRVQSGFLYSVRPRMHLPVRHDCCGQSDHHGVGTTAYKVRNFCSRCIGWWKHTSIDMLLRTPYAVLLRVLLLLTSHYRSFAIGISTIVMHAVGDVPSPVVIVRLTKGIPRVVMHSRHWFRLAFASTVSCMLPLSCTVVLHHNGDACLCRSGSHC